MGSCYSTASTGERNKKKSTGCEVDEEEAAATTSAAAGNRWWKSNKKSRAAGGYEENDGENGEGDGSVIHHHRHQIPMNGMTRMWLNGANNTETACLYTQQGKKGINQDAMLVWENFSSRTDTVFCGVFDGHGPFGHMVSKKVRDSLPLLLCTQWESDSGDGKISLYKNENALGNMNSEETISATLDDERYDSLEGQENERLPKVFLSIKKAMLKAFKLMDKELKLHPTIDCFCSGTTAVTLIKQGQDLVIGNVGDSRAVLATRDKDNALLAIQLTVDLKPDLPREAARIQQCKGRVFALQDEPEVARIWLPDSDSPGLAMARAFGDFCLKDFGLISIPEIYYYHLTTRDEFIILATDGVWDVLSNKEAVDIVASAPGRATAARALVECAARAWRLKYPTSKNDDCAVVCLFLEHSDALNSNVEECSAQKNSPLADRDTMTSVNAAELDIPVESSVALENSCASQGPDEIVSVSNFSEEKAWAKSLLQSNKTLAECIVSSEDEEWSALEGITRVNSLLSIPRFLSRDKREASWRKG